jgi:hypothetical protein
MHAGFTLWIAHHEADENASKTDKAQGNIGESALGKGALLRNFAYVFEYQVHIWASPSMERWVDERLTFAKKHLGVGLLEKKLDEMIEEQCGPVQYKLVATLFRNSTKSPRPLSAGDFGTRSRLRPNAIIRPSSTTK